MTYSRRTFLHTASAAAASGALLFHRQGPDLWRQRPADLIPEADERFLREAAAAAMDAARAAGATFADIRINFSRHAELERSSGSPFKTWPWVGMHSGYGIRAIVDGSWGFAKGTTLSLDAVTTAARTAVDLARINRPRKPRTIELAPVTVVPNGEWDTPIERDPYSVPLHEQREVMDAALAPMEKMPLIDMGIVKLDWRRSTVVFASTEGTMILQRLVTSLLNGGVFAFSSKTDPDPGYASARVTSIRPGPYGYEGLGAEKLPEGMLDAARRAIEDAKKREKPTPAEVGRFDIVFGPGAVGTLVASTLGESLDLPRALGYEANRAGTSYAAPPGDMLGKYHTAAPSITIRCDRTRQKGAATVGWDEEGVKPDEYTLIKDGVINDYQADRQTATEIGGWYRSQGQPVRSHGVMRRTGDMLPRTRLPNFTMEPSPSTTTVDDLIAGTKKGYYVERIEGASDQQVLNTQFGAAARRIVNGKLAGAASFFAFQFITPQFWKSIDGLGGAKSAKDMMVQTDQEISFTQVFPLSSASLVPIRARQVNVLNIGRTA